ncbi:MAG: hypothetical protein GX096_01605 [Clostridiales bacterium]|nr:hypothetical protein [Clostridiales bacterium]
MKHTDLDRAFRQTPSEFTQSVDLTLGRLEEEKPVKKITMRAILVAALIILLLCSVAYAVISQGQEWYYNNRFTAYQEHSPQKYEAIMGNLQKNLEQETASNPYLNVAVQDAAWLPQEDMLTLSVVATAKEDANAEVYPMMNLDADGSYAGADAVIEPSESGELMDGEDRNVHWLWTSRGFGEPDAVMKDPAKKLILFAADSVYIGTAEGVRAALDQQALGLYEGSSDGAMIHMNSWDEYVAEDDSAVTVLELKLTFLADDLDARLTQEYGNMAENYAAEYQTTRAAYDKHVDADGMLTLFIPYTVTEYQAEDDMALYTGGAVELLWVKVKVE